ncbi:MAG: hypothetical protein ACI4II_10205 [Acutalibacteraceae bacterium]
MNELKSIQDDIYNILLRDNSLRDIRFYIGYDNRKISMPLCGICACVLAGGSSLTSATANKLVADGEKGYLGTFEVEVKLYASTSSGGNGCISALCKISDVLKSKLHTVNASVDKITTGNLSFDSNMHAFTASLRIQLSAFIFEEAL